MPLSLNQEPKKIFAAQKTLIDFKSRDFKYVDYKYIFLKFRRLKIYKIDNNNIIEWFLSNFEVYFMYEYYLY